MLIVAMEKSRLYFHEEEEVKKQIGKFIIGTVSLIALILTWTIFVG